MLAPGAQPRAGRKPTHGRYTKAAVAERRAMRALLRTLRTLIGSRSVFDLADQFSHVCTPPAMTVMERNSQEGKNHHVRMMARGQKATKRIPPPNTRFGIDW
jgi:hypothetical protein